MLETIYAIRNNNVRKIPNYDPAQLDHMRKILRSLVKGKGNCIHSEVMFKLWVIDRMDTNDTTTELMPALSMYKLQVSCSLVFKSYF